LREQLVLGCLGEGNLFSLFLDSFVTLLDVIQASIAMPKGFHGGLVEFIEIVRKAGKGVATVHHGEALGHGRGKLMENLLFGICTNGQEPHEAKVGPEGCS
jgi:hypothetical protein